MARSFYDQGPSIGARLECGLASSLAEAIRELTIAHDTVSAPCSALLRGTTRDLVELFGPAAGWVTIATRIAPLSLPAFKRRALVLLAIELVSSALMHAFHGLHARHIEIGLQPAAASFSRLVVKHNGVGTTCAIPHAGRQISNDLARLLEAEIVYDVAGISGVAAEIVFPV